MLSKIPPKWAGSFAPQYLQNLAAALFAKFYRIFILRSALFAYHGRSR
jgi:hypothetical protein